MPQKPAARNVSIELLRIVAMFLILTCHFVIHFDWDHHQLRVVLPQEPGWWSALRFVIVQYGQVGVSIFFIISGYFLVEKSFKWNRLVKTWLQMFCYSVAFLIIVLLLGAFHHYPMAVEPIMHGVDFVSVDTGQFIPVLLQQLLVHWCVPADAFSRTISQYTV